MGNFVCSGMKRHKMGDSSTDMVVPRANEENLGFAFNDFDFSDRFLRLEIIPDDNSIDSDKKLILTGEIYHQPFSSINADHSKDSGSYYGAKAVTLHINSAILAAKSPFFYRLFKNGTSGESQQKNGVFLRINASEEATLMDLLNFMYENTVSATSATDLINVLIASNKFEVTSCVRYCIEMLLKLPMSLEYAILYLELPSSGLASEIVKPLVDAARKYVVAGYNDFTKSQEEAMKLPLSAVEVILKSEGLQVTSEDDVFDFIMKWTSLHYPVLEERREILSNGLARLICFPNLSRSKLKEVLVSSEFEHNQTASKVVAEALFSKVELSRGQHIHVSLATTNYGRIYRPRCVIYFDLKRDELKSLFPSKLLHSQPFRVGGRWLYLRAQCCKEKQHHCLGLFVTREQGSETCTLDYEFAVMNKSSNGFQSKGKANNVYFESPCWGMRNVLGIPWTEFMRHDDNDYFIDDILRFRAEITLINRSKP